MQKWMIHLSSEQLSSLNDESRNLGDLLSNGKGQNILVFRDSFVALKVASSLGLEPNLVRAIPAEYTSEPLSQFSKGQAIVTT
jgi:hypothetical protein